MQNNAKMTDVLGTIASSPVVTGIGSVPFTNIDAACRMIVRSCSAMPYVPQFLKIDFRENMFVQFSENLPCMAIDYGNCKVVCDAATGREDALAMFYEQLSCASYDHFKISGHFSKGFHALLEAARDGQNEYIKTQVTGPVTYLLSITDKARKSIICDRELVEAITLGLAMKALWQAGEIRQAGKKSVIFFDEPSLCDIGSAYMPVSSQQVRCILDSLSGFIRERDTNALLGLHCCGNTDWEMVFDLGFDIISFDVYGFGDRVAWYPDSLKRFLDKGGILALGIVPTSEYKDTMQEEHLYEHALGVVKSLEKGGINPEALLQRTLFTPSCGMGPLAESSAVRIMELVGNLARRITRRLEAIYRGQR